MATRIGGADCIDRNTERGDNQTWLTEMQMIYDGLISTFCIYINSGSGNIKLKVFRSNGIYWDLVGESTSQAVVAGLNSGLTANILVITGDYIGFYFDSATLYCEATLASSTVTSTHSGDVTTNTAKSEWTNISFAPIYFSISVYAILNTDVYVHSTTGNDTYAGDSCVAGHPVLTFAKAYSLLDSGGTIHVCNSGADFSAETVTLNKSFSIDLNGASGNFYGPKAA